MDWMAFFLDFHTWTMRFPFFFPVVHFAADPECLFTQARYELVILLVTLLLTISLSIVRWPFSCSLTYRPSFQQPLLQNFPVPGIPPYQLHQPPLYKQTPPNNLPLTVLQYRFSKNSRALEPITSVDFPNYSEAGHSLKSSAQVLSRKNPQPLIVRDWVRVLPFWFFGGGEVGCRSTIRESIFFFEAVSGLVYISSRYSFKLWNVA